MSLKETIVVDNLKCHGCANTIKKSLSGMEGVEDVQVDVETSEINIAFEGQVSRVDFLEKLAGLGYPEQGTGNTMQKVKSYVSCAVGRMS